MTSSVPSSEPAPQWRTERKPVLLVHNHPSHSENFILFSYTCRSHSDPGTGWLSRPVHARGQPPGHGPAACTLETSPLAARSFLGRQESEPSDHSLDPLRRTLPLQAIASRVGRASFNRGPKTCRHTSESRQAVLRSMKQVSFDRQTATEVYRW